MPRIVSFADPENKIYQAAARRIYEDAFEAEEKVPFDGIWQSAGRCQDGVGTHFWGLVEEDTLLASAWFCTLPEERLGYLGYLAVSPEARSMGYGSLLMKQVLEKIEKDLATLTAHPPLAVFWEVRSPDDAPDEDERLLRLRRIRFYQRFGAEPLAVDYLCPPIAPGQPEVKFTLMAVTCPPCQPLASETVRRIALAGLVKMEGADPQSKYVQRALASIP